MTKGATRYNEGEDLVREYQELFGKYECEDKSQDNAGSFEIFSIYQPVNLSYSSTTGR